MAIEFEDDHEVTTLNNSICRLRSYARMAQALTVKMFEEACTIQVATKQQSLAGKANLVKEAEDAP